MKYQTTLPAILIATLCATALPFASAADPMPETSPATTTATTPAVSATPKDEKANMETKINRRLEMMNKNLTLTTEQQDKIRGIMTTSMDQGKMEKGSGDSSATGGDRKGKRQEMMKKMNADIRAVLTPEQQTKFDANVAKMHKKKEGDDKANQ